MSRGTEAALSRVFLEGRPLNCPAKAEPGLSHKSGPASAVPEPPKDSGRGDATQRRAGGGRWRQRVQDLGWHLNVPGRHVHATHKPAHGSAQLMPVLLAQGHPPNNSLARCLRTWELGLPSVAAGSS